MDTIIILFISASLLTMWKFPTRNIGLVLFWVALAATLALFKYHVTSSLQLNF